MKSGSTETLVPVDLLQVKKILLEADAPLPESLLLKELFALDRVPLSRRELFRYHFSLYHALYLLKNEMTSYYLHTDCMRIRLAAIPVTTCHFYDETTGSFCDNSIDDFSYCSIHREHGINNRKPVHDVLTSFYRNSSNITFSQFDMLWTIMDRVMAYGFHYQEYNEAMKFLGIRSLSKKELTRRYRHLARLWHPDLQRGDHEKMKKLNSMYALLLPVTT